MTTGAKVALGSVAVFVVAVGGELAYLHHRNTVAENAPTARKEAYAPSRKLTDDDYVYAKKQHPDSIKDEKDLIGKTIWVSAGDQMYYYKDAASHVDYKKPVGVLRGATPLLIKGVFEQNPPATGPAVFRIPGPKHVLLAFTLPKSDDTKTLYATPVGHFVDGRYEFFTDDIYFYDDPHTLYTAWSPDAWAHIEKHEAAPGMTENQVMMALGQTIQWHGDTVGDRSITYDNNGHPVTVTFAHGKATTVKQGN